MDISSVAGRVAVSSQDDLEYQCHVLAKKYETFAESEIELMLLTAFALFNVWLTSSSAPERFRIVHGNEPIDGEPPAFLIRSQYSWNNFRIDIALQVRSMDHPIFIECDGHDFHERTKEQAERDRSRDRAIQSAGITVLRFTGREIWRNPAGCVNEVMQLVIDRLNGNAG